MWGGERFEFFSPVFNVADASITMGVLAIFVFQNKFFKKKKPAQVAEVKTETTVENTETITVAE
jgi:signal peptidase II